MQFSHTFLLRRFQIHEKDILQKQKVNDDDLIRILSVSGGHIRSLNISRCSSIAQDTFQNLSLCIGLRHLDLSFTSFTSLDALEGCLVLQSLCLSGTDIPTYRGLSKLTSLELLNLNFSSVETLKPLLSLIKLRSLDIGNTNISSISPLQNCTRLEELIMDASDINNTQAALSSIDTIRNLKQLKFVNIASTYLTNTIDQLRQSLQLNAYIDTKSRRIKWFEAIVENDVKTIEDLISQGFDTGLRAGPWAASLFLETWRGKKCSQRTPFFDCTHKDPSLRPHGIHLATFFNYRETLQILTMAKVVPEGSVWYGQVVGEQYAAALIPAPSQLPPGPATSSTTTPTNLNNIRLLPKTVFTFPEYIKDLADKRIHSVTCNLRESFPVDWRDRCVLITRELQEVIANPLAMQTIPNSAISKPVGIYKTARFLKENSETPNLLSKTSKTSSTFTSSSEVDSDAEGKEKFRSHPMIKKLREPVLIPFSANEKDRNQMKLLVTEVDSRSNRSYTSSSPTHRGSVMRKNQQIQPTMLGPKSYWLESQGPALREKAHISEEKSESLIRQKQRLKEKNKMISKLPLENLGINDKVEELSVTDLEDGTSAQTQAPQQPLTERRDAFLELLQKKADAAKALAYNRRQRKLGHNF